MSEAEVLMVGARVPSLVKWGMTPDADLVFRTLATFGPSTASTLARELGISRRRVDQSLADLRDADSVREQPRPGSRQELTWQAEPTQTVVETLHRRHYRRTLRAKPLVRNGVGAPVQLGPEIQHLPTREITRVRMADLIRRIRHEYLVLNPEPSFDSATMRGGAQLSSMLMGRGAKIRGVGLLPRNPESLVPYGGETTVTRVDYRQCVSVSMKLFVFDRQVALFPVDPGNFERGYLEVSQAPVVQSLVETFERHWGAADEPQSFAMSRFVLAERESALIALLVNGHTDASAARELHISERSVSTMMRGLMDRMGVENRFQLGVALGALRAAPDPPGLAALQTNGSGG